MTVALGKKGSVKVEDWLKVAVEVFELSLAMGKLGPGHDNGPCPLMYALAPPPLMLAKCNRC